MGKLKEGVACPSLSVSLQKRMASAESYAETPDTS
jgi:hypothetical protein